jgi:hypothetical protein
MELMLPLDLQKFQHPSAPSGEPPKKRRCRKFMSRKDLLVDLIGIEPMTSSMPWNYPPIGERAKRTTSFPTAAGADVSA